MTGVSSQRPTPVVDAAHRRAIQPASGEHDRRPHPAEPGHRAVPGRVLEERDAGDAHRRGGDGRPALGMVRPVRGQHSDERPTEREGQQDRAGDDALRARRRTRPGSAPSRRQSRGDRSGDDASHRSLRAVRSRTSGWVGWAVGRVSMLMAGSLSQSVVHCLERGRERVCSPRSDGRDRRRGCSPRSSRASSPRELIPALANTLRRWNATVRGETQICAATSLLDMPEATSRATLSSIGVRSTSVETSRLRAVSPEARNSAVARSTSGSACRSLNVSSACRRCSRAATRRWVRRSHSP